MRLPEPRLLLITDRKQARRPLPEIAELAFAAGCHWISLREKDMEASARAALFHAIKTAAARHNARAGIHGTPEEAKEIDAGCVHLPSGSDMTKARKILGADRLIGISIHSEEEARRLDPSLVDYAVAGAVFETASKPGYRPFGLDGLGAIIAASTVPVIAIGGIDPANAAAAIRTGAAGVAVMGGIMRADDPGRETGALIAALRAAG